MKRLRWRLVLIASMIAASVFSLLPRNTTQRVYDPDTGRMQDTLVRRVPISLGLDLRGGVHLALEVDDSRGAVADCADAITRAERVVRKRMDEFGTAERLVQIAGDCRLIVELPGETDPARARALVMRTAYLDFRLTDSDDRLRRALPAMDAAARRAGITAETSRPAPVAAALFGNDTAAAPDGAVSLSTLLAAGQIPGEFLVAADRVADVERLLVLPQVQRAIPQGLELAWGSQPLSLGSATYRALYAVQTRAIITGEDLQSAVAGRDPLSYTSEVQFELTRDGGRRFADATGRNIGSHLAILLDGRVEGRPPVIETRIGSSGRIQLGGRSLEEANDLALTLRAGALPAPLKVVEQRTIGPSLGHDSIRAGVRASLLAAGLVLLMVGAYYRSMGILLGGGLVLYMLFTLGGLAALGRTLTLPGLAGFALSIGMALDANVLIFERIREELRAGKAARAAVNDGFRHAMSAVVDSNITTGLTALILYLVGTGPVKGFAVTLLIGLVASMIAAIFVTRTFFLLWLGRRREPGLHGLRAQPFGGSGYDFVRKRRLAYALSGAFIVPGLLMLALHGATYSIEFTGGTMVQVRTTERVGTDVLRSALQTGGLPGAEIQQFGSDREYVVRARLADGAAGGSEEAVVEAVGTALDAGLGGGYEITRSEAVSATVGSELQQKALLAVLLSFATTLVYLAFRFHWKFGLAAVLATAHDILATMAFIRFMDLEVSLVVVAAVLTVLGYSLNDTIIIFDRVRESIARHRREGLAVTLNAAVNETLPRTVLTAVTTLAAALVLVWFAGEVIRPFALIMSFGVVVGTYSSIFVAAPLLLWIDGRTSSGRDANRVPRERRSIAGRAGGTIPASPAGHAADPAC